MEERLVGSDRALEGVALEQGLGSTLELRLRLVHRLLEEVHLERKPEKCFFDGKVWSKRLTSVAKGKTMN